jgi:type IV secretion system protein VirB2
MYRVRHTKLLKIAVITGLTVLMLSQSQDAYAQTALFDSGTNFLTALENLLTSVWARIVAIIGVVFLGFAWMFGRISMQIALSVIVGIILVMGAPAIVDSISGTL